MAIMSLTDAPNHDFDTVATMRPTTTMREHYPSLPDAIARARLLMSCYECGRSKRCDIYTPSRTYHVSANGRVWEGCSDEWTQNTREVKRFERVATY